MTVSGFTITSTSLQRDQRSRSVVQNQSLPRVQYGARPLAFEHGNLLSKGKDFEGRVASALAEDTDHGEHGQDEFGHEFSLVTRRNADLPPHSR